MLQRKGQRRRVSSFAISTLDIQGTSRVSTSRPRLWVGAFTGFYKPGVEEVRSLDPVSRFLYAARSVPWQ